MSEGHGAALPDTGKRGGERYRFWRLALLIAAVPGLIWIANWAAVHRPIAASWADDSRNEGIDLWTHYAWWVKADTVVLDVRGVGISKAPVDVMRMVFTAAEVLKDREFSEVILAYRGETRFVMDGDDFATLGRQAAYGENPVYMLRTFPEKLRDKAGRRAFQQWEGGPLGVLSKQMEDLAEFQRLWYAEDVIADMR